MTQYYHPTTVTFPLTIHPHWRETAETKGFTIRQRVKDRYHLELECHACGKSHISKLYVLMNNQPLCPHCIEAQWREDASAAGLTWLGRDPDDRHIGVYQAPCGHELRRQFVLIKRIAADDCAHRCEHCHRDKEKKEALARGWTLIGPAKDRGPYYRRYRHSCGHVQEVARVNMQSGRFNCEACGEGWASAPSYIYCMRFELPNMAPLVKLGFSRNPESRLHYQLKRSPDLRAQILRSVPVQSGHAALCLEKTMHATLKRDHVESIIPPGHYSQWLRVKSEIYSSDLQSIILGMLDALPPVEA
ncbi:hypothetical protein DD556_17690 [Phaeobacter sp. JL2872]|uniref:GIY-YIG nuclease family protein n=1 Tax=Phaeobacter sp. JL2872 TaxID=2461377 RepID=UPI000D5C7E6E|nr:GIY-YIG nuclease family protein [Phaeobacter sp. JL2872]PVZ45312.1 hypothetical protein DD556_17690 [Phaeobacter sp. JL2872]